MFKFLLKKYEKQIFELADRAVKEAEIFLGSGKGKSIFRFAGEKKFFINVKLWRKKCEIIAYMNKALSNIVHNSCCYATTNCN